MKSADILKPLKKNQFCYIQPNIPYTMTGEQ